MEAFPTIKDLLHGMTKDHNSKRNASDVVSFAEVRRMEITLRNTIYLLRQIVLRFDISTNPKLSSRRVVLFSVLLVSPNTLKSMDSSPITSGIVRQCSCQSCSVIERMNEKG
jgi:hypothetical protein